MRRYNRRFIVDLLSDEVIHCRGRMQKVNGHLWYMGSTDGVNWVRRWFRPGFQEIAKSIGDLAAMRLRGKRLILPDDMSW